jgi:3-oxoacyl-[acyl-carrier-protein] synthase-1
MSTPHPEGLGAKLAMRQALESAELAPADIDYINLHGTATRTNDASEDKAVVEVFGSNTPCSSTKGATGHLLGTAGITEAIVSILAIEHGLMPGSANTQRVDPELKSRYRSRIGKARSGGSSPTLSISRSNCSLILGRPVMRVFVEGVGLLGPG